MASETVCVPWEPVQLTVTPLILMEPLQYTLVSGVTTPSSRALDAVTALKVEPGS